MREPERDAARLLATPGSYAYLRISHGCDHTCSFCAIPAIRGPHRSKRPDDVLDEARELIGAGVRELVLVAEDSTAWGRDLGLELPAPGRGAGRARGPAPPARDVRLPQSLPLAARCRSCASTRASCPTSTSRCSTSRRSVLRAMRRAGSGDQVRAILDRLLAEVPGITLRTTLLVGFPGETDADVAELVDFVRDYRLGRLGASPTRREQGTPGYELEGAADEAVATERRAQVLAARDEVLRGEPDGPDRERARGAGRRGAPRAPREGALARGARRHGCARGRSGGRGRARRRPRPDAAVGDRLRVRVEGLDEDQNLLCVPARGAGAPGR